MALCRTKIRLGIAFSPGGKVARACIHEILTIFPCDIPQLAISCRQVSLWLPSDILQALRRLATTTTVHGTSKVQVCHHRYSRAKSLPVFAFPIGKRLSRQPKSVRSTDTKRS